MNAVELSPLTPQGMAKRISSDLHPGRSEAALCTLVLVLADIASGRSDADAAGRMLRGLASAAQPDEYAEAVRQSLQAAGAYL